ncbi:hypothetical protein BaRGS_00007795 [Batillaria attramentaria]|uniref:Uncharacterized protein n=1 Tax=Batillaria attramentaria TaxID=370345 RepID=A0ABD0LN23_9CAEN
MKQYIYQAVRVQSHFGEEITGSEWKDAFETLGKYDKTAESPNLSKPFTESVYHESTHGCYLNPKFVLIVVALAQIYKNEARKGGNTDTTTAASTDRSVAISATGRYQTEFEPQAIRNRIPPPRQWNRSLPNAPPRPCTVVPEVSGKGKTRRR